MRFVLDASATLAFIFPDERDAAAIRLAEHVRAKEALVPHIWLWEVQNAIITVERRGRLTNDLASELLGAAAELPVVLDASEGAHVELARRFNLSAYDALYLDLAFRRHFPLATRDTRLIAAARILDIPTAF